MNKLLYRPKEAAQMLGIGRDKLYDLMRSGRLRSVKDGRAGSSRPRPWQSTSRCWKRRRAKRHEARGRQAKGYRNILSITSAPVVITGRSSCR
jgi:excisionase family DNA binding protein